MVLFQRMRVDEAIGWVRMRAKEGADPEQWVGTHSCVDGSFTIRHHVTIGPGANRVDHFTVEKIAPDGSTAGELPL